MIPYWRTHLRTTGRQGVDFPEPGPDGRLAASPPARGGRYRGPLSVEIEQGEPWPPLAEVDACMRPRHLNARPGMIGVAILGGGSWANPRGGLGCAGGGCLVAVRARRAAARAPRSARRKPSTTSTRRSSAACGRGRHLPADPAAPRAAERVRGGQARHARSRSRSRWRTPRRSWPRPKPVLSARAAPKWSTPS